MIVQDILVEIPFRAFPEWEKRRWKREVMLKAEAEDMRMEKIALEIWGIEHEL